MLSDKQIHQFKQQIIEMKEEAEQEMEKYKEDDAKELYPNDRTGEISSVADIRETLGQISTSGKNARPFMNRQERNTWRRKMP